MKSTETATSGTGEKLPYTAPTLTIHGDLRTMTAAKGGNRKESGQPKTFPTSAP
jgi:hypothetical protein